MTEENPITDIEQMLYPLTNRIDNHVSMHIRRLKWSQSSKTKEEVFEEYFQFANETIIPAWKESENELMETVTMAYEEQLGIDIINSMFVLQAYITAQCEKVWKQAGDKPTMIKNKLQT